MGCWKVWRYSPKRKYFAWRLPRGRNPTASVISVFQEDGEKEWKIQHIDNSKDISEIINTSTNRSDATRFALNWMEEHPNG